MELLNYLNKFWKYLLKSNYFTTIFMVLILTLLVSGMLFLVQKFDYLILENKKQNITPTNLKNVLIVLMENYEKNLLDLRTKIDDEKKLLLEKLNSAETKNKKDEIENQLKEIENKQKNLNTNIANITKEKNNLDQEIRIKNEKLNQLSIENENLKKELIDLKLYNEDYDKLKSEHEETIKNFEEITLTLAGGNKKLLNRINKINREKAKNKNNMLNYIEELKEISDVALKDKIADNKSNNAISNAQKDKEIEENNDNIKKLNEEKTALEKKMKEELETKTELEKKMGVLNNNIKEFEHELKDRSQEIETLFELSDINGYFISKNGETILIINEKKRNEIISRGTYDVYDENKKIISKINISSDKNGNIKMIKIPGYKTPVEGNWF